MRKIKRRLFLLMIPLLVVIFGVSYAFFIYHEEGNNHVAIAGNLYLNMSNDEDISITGLYPMTDEYGILNGVKYNFNVSGYNTTNKNIDYGVYVIDGDEISGKTKLRYTDIKVYLEEFINGKKTGVYGPINLADFNENLIYANTIGSNVSKENQVNINYTLTTWIDEKVLISDVETDVFGRSVYTSDEFKNSYASLKVKVEGLTDDINLPLTIETNDSFIENNQAYFFAKINNYTNESEIGSLSKDEIILEVIGDNPNITFSYKDSEGNVATDSSSSLNLKYVFTKKKAVEIQIFYSSTSEANQLSNINLKLTKNGELLQNIVKNITVYGDNYCLINGFDKLYDCILVSDSLASSMATAKVNIENKGEATINATAPTFTYIEEEIFDVENVYSFSNEQFTFADSYEFDESTGSFRIYNASDGTVIRDFLSDTYKNYYTCGQIGSGSTNCLTIYRIKETNVDGTKYTISLGDKITYKLVSSIRSEVGLYKTVDDYGDAYFYRGDVSNNNVYFGGYYWKIIRTNGDNSIRLVYSGSTANATGKDASVNNSLYYYGPTLDDSPNSVARVSDPTYVGYMYGKNFTRQTSEEFVYSASISSTNEYYWADSLEFDETNKVFKLKKEKLEPIKKTFNEMNVIADETTGQKLYELYPYTCKSDSFDSSCEVILQLNGFKSTYDIYAKVISYSSTDKEGTRTNEISSNAKKEIDLWYETNIINKKDSNGNLLASYIVDGTFCNDRSSIDSKYNSGFLLSEITRYSAYTRLRQATDVKPTLKCNDDVKDWFSHTPERGNGNLSHPIALMTADEVIFAGGKFGEKNFDYYLYNSGSSMTMTPSSYLATMGNAQMFLISEKGNLNVLQIGTKYGLRPVINLHPDVLISQGDGTIENPFQLKLS